MGPISFRRRNLHNRTGQKGLNEGKAGEFYESLQEMRQKIASHQVR